MPRTVNRFLSHSVGALLAITLGSALLAGCASKRPPQTPEALLQKRDEFEQQVAADSKAVFDRQLEYVHNKPEQPATIDVLVISGGGDWGAFGAGVLKGWGRIPAGPMARPQFDIVTGVSTGALIAPFAFLGQEGDIDNVLNLYRNPKKDWVKTRGFLYFLPSNLSFAEVPGLEREMREHVNLATLQRIVDAGKTGRLLLVNTTNIDEGDMHVWDVVAESQRCLQAGNAERVNQILLASSGIPGAFPAREIDGWLYVDGAMTGNILYGARQTGDDALAARWAKTYPNAPQPKIRYWVIFNNKLRPAPQVIQPTWPAVVARSIETASRFGTISSIRHLYSMAEVSRLTHHNDVEVRLICVPNDFEPPKPGVFVKETMDALADIGERMGADPSSWQTESP